MSNTIPREADGLATEMRHVIDEADQFLKSATSSGDKTFDAVRSKFSEQVSLMQTQLNQLEKDGMARARRAARVADQSVHDHPYSAMGVAAAAGLLLGFLVARR